MWVAKGIRPIRVVSGKHGKKENTVVFGAIDIDWRQIFRQYDEFNGKTFLDFLKKMHGKYGKLYLFLDKASQHTTKAVKEYIRKTLRVRWIPTACPEFNMIEECWREGEKDLATLPKFPRTKKQLKKILTKYYRTKRFSNLRMDKFLLTNRCL